MLEADLRTYLEQQLPHYMVPTLIVELDELPLTPNRKVDTKALPAPPATATGTPADLAPRDEIERSVAAAWNAVLRVDGIGVRDNFFRLGGHSFHLMQVVAKLRDTHKVALSPRAFFERPTVEALAAQVREALHAGEGVDER
ncbi:phosphopantetheine-binding protein [Streptomyces sp. NPDC059913]|uniref:phosphopantetheine-binding protein n=1 Tax=unclassified Streptomyces TaxID=2593676 RepID=UPI003661DE0A